MNKLFIIFFLFISNACAKVSEQKYFICDMLKGNINSAVDPQRPHDKKFDYFDRTFFYKKAGNNTYIADFSFGNSLGIQFTEPILSDSYLRTARKQQGFYREIFDIYRFNVKTNILIHSYLYYLHTQDYNKNFNNPQFVPFNNPLLFDLVPREAPQDYVKIGWDKTKWQCYKISYIKYMFLSVQELIIRVFVGGIT